jgi:hypothetical protein
MNAMPETAFIAPADLESRTAFVQYLSDALVQFTRMAESLELNQIAYFLSMAAIETSDYLGVIEAESAPSSAQDTARAA